LKKAFFEIFYIYGVYAFDAPKKCLYRTSELRKTHQTWAMRLNPCFFYRESQRGIHTLKSLKILEKLLISGHAENGDADSIGY
jgi:hypothetical protein